MEGQQGGQQQSSEHSARARQARRAPRPRRHRVGGSQRRPGITNHAGLVPQGAAEATLPARPRGGAAALPRGAPAIARGGTGPAARAARSPGLALLAPRLVDGGGSDALGRAGAAAAGLRRTLDVLVLPLALVAPGLRHSVSSGVHSGGHHSTSWGTPLKWCPPDCSASYVLDFSGERGRSKRTSGSSSTAAAKA